jgi:hypothetical protein
LLLVAAAVLRAKMVAKVVAEAELVGIEPHLDLL